MSAGVVQTASPVGWDPLSYLLWRWFCQEGILRFHLYTDLNMSQGWQQHNTTSACLVRLSLFISFVLEFLCLCLLHHFAFFYYGWNSSVSIVPVLRPQIMWLATIQASHTLPTFPQLRVPLAWIIQSRQLVFWTGYHVVVIRDGALNQID
jgi:hypothetical protein